MTTEAHDEERVRRAVVTAVEAIGGPDRGRLARIEQRLLAQRRRRRAAPWWWAVLAVGLAAGAASAYWGFHTPHDESDAGGPPVPTREDRPVDASGAGDGPGESADGSGKSQDGDDPIIYIGQ